MSDDYTPQKACVECGTVYPRTAKYFNKQKDTKDGLTNLCKVCAKRRANEWYQRNKERANARSKSWYEANRESDLARKRERNNSDPEFRQAAIERAKRFREEHPERFKERRDGWYKENKARVRSKSQEWRKNNPARYRVMNKKSNAKRKSIIRDAPGSHTAEDIRNIYDEQEGRCAYCGITLNGEFHLDHVKPLIHGGSNDPDNLACACADCNLSKGDKLLVEWIAWREW